MVENNLIFHYQLVIHNIEDGVYLHEAFSTRYGELYMLNPIPAEIFGDSEDEIDLLLKAMDRDSVKYRPVHITSAIPQIERWTDEVDVSYEFVEPLYEDEDSDLTDEHLDKHGEVIDIYDYITKRS